MEEQVETQKKDRDDKLAEWEVIGSILWFTLDGFWLFELKECVYVFVIPTVLANLMVFRYTKKSVPQMSITAAMAAWVLMNTLWIIADFNDYAAI